MADVASSWTPYRYGFDNPVSNIDLFGMLESTHTDSLGNVVAVYNDGDKGVYKHKGNAEEAKKEVEENHSKYNTSAGGEYMGETPYLNEFREGNRILFGEKWTDDVIERAIGAYTESKGTTAFRSTPNARYDLKKDSEIAIYGPGTGKLLGGKYITAQSAGNFLAGFNGAMKQGLSFEEYMKLAGALNQGIIAAGNHYLTGKTYGSYPWFGETEYAGRMILWGWLTAKPSDEYAMWVKYWYQQKLNK